MFQNPYASWCGGPFDAFCAAFYTGAILSNRNKTFISFIKTKNNIMGLAGSYLFEFKTHLPIGSLFWLSKNFNNRTLLFRWPKPREAPHLSLPATPVQESLQQLGAAQGAGHAIQHPFLSRCRWYHQNLQSLYVWMHKASVQTCSNGCQDSGAGSSRVLS